MATLHRPRRVCRAFAGSADAHCVSSPDETFIVRVRRQEGDAVVEQPRMSRRRRVGDVAEVGPLILRWLRPAQSRSTEPAAGARRTREEGGAR
jgi:hypothetical protein